MRYLSSFVGAAVLTRCSGQKHQLPVITLFSGLKLCGARIFLYYRHGGEAHPLYIFRRTASLADVQCPLACAPHHFLSHLMTMNNLQFNARQQVLGTDTTSMPLFV